MSTRDDSTFPGRYESLPEIAEFAAQAARAAGLDPSAVYAFQLAVDEACSNIIEHAYGGEDSGDIRCTYELDGTALRFRIHDTGRAFDPSAVPEPDLSTPLESRQIGGLGLFIIYRIMDDVQFDFGDSGNVLTLTKRLERST